MLYGVIDIGSNTIRLTVYEVDQTTGDFSPFFKLKTMAGLVSYIDQTTKRMSQAGIKRLIGVLKDYLACTAHFRDLKGPYAFATAGVRNASNAQEVLSQVEQACGIPIELVSGQEEARLGFIGTLGQSTINRGVHIDVGGGSSEVALFSNHKITYATSLPYGSLSLFDQCVHDILPVPAEIDHMQDIIAEALKADKNLTGKTYSHASGTGGSVRAAKRLRDAWITDKDNNPGIITHKQIHRLIEHTMHDPHTALRDILRIAPERVHTCVPGLAIIDALMSHFDIADIEVNDRGVREGYLIEKVLSKSQSL